MNARQKEVEKNGIISKTHSLPHWKLTRFIPMPMSDKSQKRKYADRNVKKTNVHNTHTLTHPSTHYVGLFLSSYTLEMNTFFFPFSKLDFFFLLLCLRKVRTISVFSKWCNWHSKAEKEHTQDSIWQAWMHTHKHTHVHTYAHIHKLAHMCTHCCS